MSDDLTACPNECERFGGKVPGWTVGSNWDWVACPEGHEPQFRTSDEQLVATLRAECVEFHAGDGVTDDCAYVQAADRLAEARDEITRLRAERAKVTGHNRTDLGIVYGYELGRDDTLAEIAALDAGDALNVGPDTTGEGT